MLDGIELKGRCCVVCLGVSTDGIKVPLGLWDGSTENKTVTKHLLSDLVHRGLDVEQGVLVVLDGSKALRAAVREVFGPVPVQRCVRHKERGVLDHLPELNQGTVKMRLRKAWASEDHELALDGLRLLAGELDRSYPGRRRVPTRRHRGDAHADPPRRPQQPRSAEQLSRVVDEAMKDHQAATFSSVVSSWLVSSSVTGMPSVYFAPASTSATSSWPLKRRQRSWAASSSL